MTVVPFPLPHQREAWESLAVWSEKLLQPGAGSWLLSLAAPAGWGKTFVLDQLGAGSTVEAIVLRVSWSDDDVGILIALDDIGTQLEQVISAVGLTPDEQLRLRMLSSGLLEPAQVASHILFLASIFGIATGVTAPLGIAIKVGRTARQLATRRLPGTGPPPDRRLAETAAVIRVLASRRPVLLLVDEADRASGPRLATFIRDAMGVGEGRASGGRLHVIAAARLSPQHSSLGPLFDNPVSPFGTASILEQSPRDATPVDIVRALEAAFPGRRASEVEQEAARLKTWQSLGRVLGEQRAHRTASASGAHGDPLPAEGPMHAGGSAGGVATAAISLCGDFITSAQIGVICAVLGLDPIATGYSENLKPVGDGLYRNESPRGDAAAALSRERHSELASALVRLAHEKNASWTRAVSLQHLRVAAEHDETLLWSLALEYAALGALRSAIEVADEAPIHSDPNKRMQVELWRAELGEMPGGDTASSTELTGRMRLERGLAAASLEYVRTGGVQRSTVRSLSETIDEVPPTKLQLATLYEIAIATDDADFFRFLLARTGDLPIPLRRAVDEFVGSVGGFYECRMALARIEGAKRMGADDLMVADLVHQAAETFVELGWVTEGASLCAQAWRVRRASLPADHASVLDSRHFMAYCGFSLAVDAQQRSEAAAAMRIVAGARWRSLGADHPDTLASLHDAEYFRWIADGKPARVKDVAAMFRVADARRRVLEDSHIDTLVSRSVALEMAWPLRSGLDEQREMLQEAEGLVEALSTALGPNARMTLANRSSLCRFRLEAFDRSSDQGIEALEELRSIADDAVRYLGDHHPEARAHISLLKAAESSAQRRD